MPNRKPLISVGYGHRVQLFNTDGARSIDVDEVYSAAESRRRFLQLEVCGWTSVLSKEDARRFGEYLVRWSKVKPKKKESAMTYEEWKNAGMP